MYQGSSPRMRGALKFKNFCPESVRIIPAYAGSTPLRRSQWSGLGNHPRVCGEHSSTSKSMERARGSSPRMRGALPLGRHGHALTGIIPAYAGSTRSWRAMKSATVDHPRVCGEHRSS